MKSTLANWFRGDFANITLVRRSDPEPDRQQSLFTGTRWGGNLTELEMQWGRTIGQMPSPYTGGQPVDRALPMGAYDTIRLSRSVWIQLAILTTITVVAVGIAMAIRFRQGPGSAQFGRYTFTVQLPAAGGLNPTSVVTYCRYLRPAGSNRSASPDAGVDAVLTLDSGIPVPSPVSAAVHSRVRGRGAVPRDDS